MDNYLKVMKFNQALTKRFGEMCPYFEKKPAKKRVKDDYADYCNIDPALKAGCHIKGHYQNCIMIYEKFKRERTK